MRILGKGLTAQAITKVYPDALLFDDNDKDIYDINSREVTIVSPGIPPYNYLVQNTKNIISDYDLFLDNNKFTIWISGTNGKTTTTSMMYHLLKEYDFFCGGNIGTPLAQIYQNKNIILETSSFTLHYTNKAKPNIYILLPISDDHTSWHGSFEEYEKAKLKPLGLMDTNDIAIIPNEYKNIKTKAKVVVYKDSKDLANQFDIDEQKINFKEPFLTDALLAMAVEKIRFNKIDYEKINSYIQDPHKIEEFKDKFGRLWVDDSKATNLDATIQAVKTYKEKQIFLILGGDDKGANLIPLFEELKKYNVEIFTIGTNTQKLQDLANRYEVVATMCYYLKDAVENISKNRDFSLENSVAILSPAAASLDQFISYKQRGENFKVFVHDLSKY